MTFLGGLSVLLLLHATTLEMIAQQSEVDRKSLAEIRAKAEKGDTEFRYELGAVFNFGNLGVAKDQVESYKWCLLAAGQGDEKAKKRMAVSESRLAREQVSEGRKRARNFKPRGEDSQKTGFTTADGVAE